MTASNLRQRACMHLFKVRGQSTISLSDLACALLYQPAGCIPDRISPCSLALTAIVKWHNCIQQFDAFTIGAPLSARANTLDSLHGYLSG